MNHSDDELLTSIWEQLCSCSKRPAFFPFLKAHFRLFFGSWNSDQISLHLQHDTFCKDATKFLEDQPDHVIHSLNQFAAVNLELSTTMLNFRKSNYTAVAIFLTLFGIFLIPLSSLLPLLSPANEQIDIYLFIMTILLIIMFAIFISVNMAAFSWLPKIRALEIKSVIQIALEVRRTKAGDQ